MTTAVAHLNGLRVEEPFYLLGVALGQMELGQMSGTLRENRRFGYQEFPFNPYCQNRNRLPQEARNSVTRDCPLRDRAHLGRRPWRIDKDWMDI